MRSFKKLSLVAAALMASSHMVQAADLLPPQVEELPPEVSVAHAAAGGWYIRGDIGYAGLDHKGVNFLQGSFFTGNFSVAELDDTFSFQGGIGYQVNDYLRVDATYKYLGSADFTGVSPSTANPPCNGFAGNTCQFEDNSELESASVFLANAYLDLGTVNGLTPYIGAGIGGAHVSYGDLFNDQTCDPAAPAACSLNDTIHSGADSLRFAYAFHAGASFDVNCRTKIDAGYSFTRIEGGKQFGSGVGTPGSLAPGVSLGGDGYDDGIDVHEGRVGLRYSLDGSGCSTPSTPPVVYK